MPKAQAKTLKKLSTKTIKPTREGRPKTRK